MNVNKIDNGAVRRSRVGLLCAGLVGVGAAATANAAPTLLQGQGLVQPSTVLPFAGGTDQNNPLLVTPASGFSFVVAGFNSNNSGNLLTSAEVTPFGTTQTYPAAALGGQTLTITSSETVGVTTTTDLFTISVPTNFDPAGTTVGSQGTAVTSMEADIGGYNAGPTPITFAIPINPATFTATGNMVYSGGSFALSPAGNDHFDPTDTQLASAEGVNAGGSDLSGFGIHSFTFSFSYPTAAVPEPTSAGLVMVAAGAALLRRRRVASV